MANRSLPPAYALRWPPLVPGILLRRYKRFLADVTLSDGRTVTAHCPNSGSMTGCCEPGRQVYLSRHDTPGRKLKYTWEIIRMPASLVGVNTNVPNRLLSESIRMNRVAEIAGYTSIRPEYRVSPRSRLDLMLQADGRPPCFVEIKNCTLVTGEAACFPDAVTARGLKHLAELTRLADGGFRAVIFFVVQRADARLFRPADDIDPAYGRGLRQALKSGVEILAYDTAIDLTGISLRRKLPVDLSPPSSG